MCCNVWDIARGMVSQEWLAHRGGVHHLALDLRTAGDPSLGRWESEVHTV